MSAAAPPRKTRAVAAPNAAKPVKAAAPAPAPAPEADAPAPAPAPEAKKARAAPKAKAAAADVPADPPGAAAAAPAAKKKKKADADAADPVAAPVGKKRARSATPDGEPAATSTRARRAAPISPKSAASRLVVRNTTGAEVVLSYSDIRSTADAVARNISRVMAISRGVAKAKDGKFTAADGRVYDDAAVREARGALESSIRRIAPACLAATRRRTETLTAAEVDERRAAHIARITRGATEVASALGAPRIARVLIAKETARINARARVPKPDAGRQISGVFLITDQFRKFVTDGEFGNGLANFFGIEDATIRAMSGATDPEAAKKAVSDFLGKDVVTELGYPPCEKKGCDDSCKTCKERTLGETTALKIADPRNVLGPLLTQRGVATSPLLMSIMARYVAANKLKDEKTGRIKVDDNMKKNFGTGNTRWLYLNNDYTPANASEALALPALERIRAREHAEGTPDPYDGTSYTRAMSIAIATMYRIPVTPEKFKAFLANPRITDLATGLNAAL